MVFKWLLRQPATPFGETWGTIQSGPGSSVILPLEINNLWTSTEIEERDAEFIADLLSANIPK